MVVHSDSVWPWVWLLVWLSTQFCVQVCVVQVNGDGTDIMEMHANTWDVTLASKVIQTPPNTVSTAARTAVLTILTHANMINQPPFRKRSPGRKGLRAALANGNKNPVPHFGYNHPLWKAATIRSQSRSTLFALHFTAQAFNVDYTHHTM
ncbi:hypothetical protein V8E53_010021 [Lactarius tabidus]